MLRSLFITTIYPPKVGGIELCLYNIIKRLPPQKVTVLTQRQKGDREFDQKQDYLIYRRGLERKTLKPRWLLSPIFALKICLKSKIETVHAAHGFGSYFAAFWVKKILGIPYFVWAYGLDILSMQKSRFVGFWVRKIFREADGGIANSNFTRKLMQGMGLDKDKIVIVYPGVNTKRFKPSLGYDKVRKKYNIPRKRFVLLSVSRLVARKGFDLVLGALPQISEKFPNTIYIIGGRGPDEGRLKRILRQKPQVFKAVRFIGFVEEKDLPPLYNLADVFLMPSRQILEDVEGFGMVFLEAGACCCPVIGGKSGGIPEAILDGETGFLVDPLNPNDLADKVIRLLGDEGLRKKMGRAARKRAVKEFNWEKIVKNFQFSMTNLQSNLNFQ